MSKALEIKNLKKYYPVKKFFKSLQHVKALDDISFSLEENETLGVVGESGCGKSTLAKQILRLEEKTAGEIHLPKREGPDSPPVQMIFQDPCGSLNPRKRCWQLIAAPLMIHQRLDGKEYYRRALEMMKLVGLRPELANRYPHMFSGGQRQRIGIARALILKPQILVCDEPVSALDVSIQAQVLNLLVKLQKELKLAYIFISHDLAVVKHIADTILVMYLGKIVEYGPREQIFNNPLHPYTKALLASSPSLFQSTSNTPELAGELPSPLNPPRGCHFHQRCPEATEECLKTYPEMREIDKRWACCHKI